MLSKVKNYFKNNYDTNLKPFFEKTKGKVALKWSILSLAFYTVISATLAFMPEAPPPQGEITLGPLLAVLAIAVIVYGGMFSIAIIAEKLLFLSGKTSKYYEKVKLVVCSLIAALAFSSHSTNFLLMYLIPIISMVGVMGVFDSIFNLIMRRLETKVESEKDISALKLSKQGNSMNPQLNKVQEEIEVEQELGLTQYFTKNKD